MPMRPASSSWASSSSPIPESDACELVARLQRLGLEIKVLTGDNERTARTSAARLPASPAATTWAGLTDAELSGLVTRTTVFARVGPEQKAALVAAAQHNGDDVAFLGDGVNDAVALHRADVGISADSAVGRRPRGCRRRLAGEELGRTCRASGLWVCQSGGLLALAIMPHSWKLELARHTPRRKPAAPRPRPSSSATPAQRAGLPPCRSCSSAPGRLSRQAIYVSSAPTSRYPIVSVRLLRTSCWSKEFVAASPFCRYETTVAFTSVYVTVQRATRTPSRFSCAHTLSTP